VRGADQSSRGVPPSVYECVCECDLETSKTRRPKLTRAVAPCERKLLLFCFKVLASLFNMAYEGVLLCLCAFISA